MKSWIYGLMKLTYAMGIRPADSSLFYNYDLEMSNR